MTRIISRFNQNYKFYSILLKHDFKEFTLNDEILIKLTVKSATDQHQNNKITYLSVDFYTIEPIGESLSINARGKMKKLENKILHDHLEIKTTLENVQTPLAFSEGLKSINLGLELQSTGYTLIPKVYRAKQNENQESEDLDEFALNPLAISTV